MNQLFIKILNWNMKILRNRAKLEDVELDDGLNEFLDESYRVIKYESKD